MTAFAPYAGRVAARSLRARVLDRLACSAVPLSTVELARACAAGLPAGRERVYTILTWEWRHGRAVRHPPPPGPRRRGHPPGRRSFRWAMTADGLREYLRARGWRRKEVRG